MYQSQTMQYGMLRYGYHLPVLLLCGRGRLCPLFCIVEIFLFSFAPLTATLEETNFRSHQLPIFLLLSTTGIFRFLSPVFMVFAPLISSHQCQVLGGMCHDTGTVSWCLFHHRHKLRKKRLLLHPLSVIKTQADISHGMLHILFLLHYKRLPDPPSILKPAAYSGRLFPP